MNSINKYMFLLTCFNALSCNASEYEKSETKIIQELKNEFKKKYIAHEADEIINNITQDTLKKCGIKRPVIILQRDEGNNSYTCSNPSKHPQEFIIIGTKGQSLDQITFDIYHEVGHIAHGDVLQKKQQLDRHYVHGTTGLSTLVGLGTGVRFYKYMKKPISGLLVGTTMGGLAALVTMISGTFAMFYRESLKELKADAFAYENLIKHGKLNVAIIQISDFLYKHEHCNNIAPLPSFVCGYPNNFQRAKNGLKVLQKQGINISTLIKDLPEDLDQGVKEHFPTQIQRFFPDLANVQNLESI